MEDLTTAIGSQKQQGANLTTLGRSADSAIPIQSNNHDSLQQKPQISTHPELQAARIPNNVRAFAPEPIAPQVAAFDATSKSFFTVLAQRDCEEHKSPDEIDATTALLRVPLTPQNETGLEKRAQEWSHEPLNAERGSEITPILSNNGSRTQGLPESAPRRVGIRFNKGSENADLLAFSPSGLTVEALDAKKTHARVDMPMTEGVHYWEISCPHNLQGLQFGITTKGSKPIQVLQSFHSTSERVVGVQVNFNTCEVSYYLQSKYCKKQKIKFFDPQELEWYPVVQFNQLGQSVTFNPFRDKPVPETTSTQQITRLPEMFTYSAAHAKVAIMEHLIGNRVLVTNQVPSGDNFNFAQYLAKVPDLKFEILAQHAQPDPSDNNKAEIRCALLQLATYDDVIRLLKTTPPSSSKTKHSVYHARMLAKALLNQSEEVKNVNSKAIEVQPAHKETLDFLRQAIAMQHKSKPTLLTVLEPKAPENHGLAQVLESTLEQHSAGNVKKPIVAVTEKGKLIVASGSEVKIMGQGADLSLFSNFPCDFEDNVFLNINRGDLAFLLHHADASSPHVQQFYASVSKNYDGQRASLPYILAFFGVKELLSACTKQYKQMESVANDLAIADSSADKRESKSQGEGRAKLSFTDMHLLLNICVALEDQIWAMTQHQRVPQHVKNLWQQTSVRTHTAFGRLQSMQLVEDGADQFRLAELGLINEWDNQRHFVHFQEPYVPIESIYDRNLVDSLQKQLPGNQHLSGLATWNVPLDQTLNSFPPECHDNALPQQVREANNIPAQGQIDQVIQVGNYVVTANHQHASLNVFSSQLGLQKSLRVNFKKQKYQKAENAKKLRHLTLKKTFDNEHVLIHSRKGDMIPLFDASAVKQEVPTAALEEVDSPTAEEEGLLALFQLEDEKKHEVLSSYASSDSDECDDTVEYPSIYEAMLSEPEQTATPAAKQDVQSKSAEKKSPAKTEDPQLKNQKAEMKNQLKNLGFTNDQIDAAIAKAKIPLQMDLIIDLIVEGQTQSAKNQPAAAKDEITWLAFQCEACTFQNNAGKQACEMCETAAPESAKLIKKAPEPTISKEDQQKLDLAKEKELKAALRAEEEKKRLEDEKHRAATILKECQGYFQDLTVLKFVATSHNQGRDFMPLIMGCAMQGQGWVDLHLSWARYSKNFREMVQKNYQNLHSKENINQTWNSIEAMMIHTFPQQKQTLRSQSIAVCRLYVDEVTSIFQSNNDLNDQNHWQVFISGKKEGKHITTVFTIDSKGFVTYQKLDTLDGVAVTAGCSHGDKVVLQYGNTLKLFSIEAQNPDLLTEELVKELPAGSQLVGVSNGVISVHTGNDKIEVFDLSTSRPWKSQTAIEQEGASSATQDAKSILNMQIDPSKITVDEIDRYENLMLGDGALGTSNSTHCFTNESKPSWQVHDSVVAGPFDFRLNIPTNVISLNIDLQFRSLQDPQITTTNTAKSQDRVQSIELPEAQQQPATYLGAFSMKGFSGEQGNSTSEIQENNLPLIVKQAKGSSYNSQLIPSKLLTANDALYASNYARPHIVFAHTEELQMEISKVTIRSLFVSKTGAYPMGEGLIFLSDTLQPFEEIDAFAKFNHQKYTQWKIERALDLRPLRANEPVAYFVFDENQQISFELDYKRPARYILVVPTGFRQKPQAFLQNADFVPMEFQYFGVSGSVVQSDQSVLDQVQTNDPSFNIQLELASGCDLVVELSNRRKEQTSFTIENVKIDQLVVGNKNISSDTYVRNKAKIQSNLIAEAKALIRVTDSRLSLQVIDHVRVFIRQREGAEWRASHASIQCMQGRQTNTGETQNKPLFDSQEISGWHFRSCLLDPQFFSVVNKQIVHLIFNDSVSHRLRSRAISFVAGITKKNQAIANLIINEIDVKKYIMTNMLNKNSESMISVASELITSFQSNPVFLENLYKFLIEQTALLPSQVFSYDGYLALIGILKWALPLDRQKSLQVLTKTLFEDLNAQIRSLQNENEIQYRTRHYLKDTDQQYAYPFDTYSFEPSKKKNASQETAPTKLVKGKNLLTTVTQERRMDVGNTLEWFGGVENRTPDESSNNNSNQHYSSVYLLDFHVDTHVDQLKIFFGPHKSSGTRNIRVTVTNSKTGKCIFLKQYPCHTFYQHVELPNEDVKTPNQLPLTISDLATYTSALRVRIDFFQLGRKLPNEKNPDAIITCYGKVPESSIVEATKAQQQTSANISEDKATKTKVGNTTYLMQGNFCIPAPPSDEAQESSSQAQNNAAGTESKPLQQVLEQSPAPDLTELKKLQETLADRLSANKIQKDQLISLVAKIHGQQQRNHWHSSTKPEHSLQYLMRMSADLCKLIMTIYKPDETKLSFEPSVEFCFDFFTLYVVNDVGQEDALKLLKELLLPLLTREQLGRFRCRIVHEYLSRPIKHISQKALLDALVFLGICAYELIRFMVENLEANSYENPANMMFSVLSLVLQSYESIKQDEVVKDSPATEALKYDQQASDLFYTVLRVCKNERAHLSKKEQVALLNFLATCLKEISKAVKVSTFAKLVSDFDAVQSIETAFICQQNSSFFKVVLSYTRKTVPSLIKTKDPSQEAKNIEIIQEHIKVHNALQKHHIEVMNWLLDYRLGVKASASAHQAKIIDLCDSNKTACLSSLVTLIDLFLGTREVILQDQKNLKQFPDSQKYIDSSEETSLIPIIQKLINLLCLCQKQGATQEEIQHVWSISLRSLQAVEVNQMADSEILEKITDVFLSSSHNIQQTTFTQILKICQEIATTDKNGRFLCKQILKTMSSIRERQHVDIATEKVVISCIQGWLDIMVLGHVSANTKHTLAETRYTNSLHCSLEVDDLLELLIECGHYLQRHLNQGTFEGSSGCDTLLVCRMNMVVDLLLVCETGLTSKERPTKTLQELFKECQKSKDIQSKLAGVFDNIISWLFLSGRTSEEEQELQPLAGGMNTSASILAMRITDHILAILSVELGPDNRQNTETIKLALASLTKVVRSMNTTLTESMLNEKISFFIGVKLTKRTNDFFIKLIKAWLQTNHMAEYFAFTLRGFEFLLDTIGAEGKPKSDSTDSPIQEESKESEYACETSLEGSDLAKFFLEFAKSTSPDSPDQQKSDAKAQSTTAAEQADDGAVYKAPIIDLVKNPAAFKLHESSGPEAVTQWAQIDWTVNKKTHKHRIYLKQLKDRRGFLEHEMLFKLSDVAVVREIQLGMVNYWNTDSEVHIEPMSVLVQAGMDKDNLQLVCSLDLLQEPAFLSVSSSVFAKNMQEYDKGYSGSLSVEELVRQKIASLPNFKIQWVKFSMRRNQMACIENSPLANRFEKTHFFGINYISMPGYKTTDVSNNVPGYILKEQKKTAISVMTQLCSGDFKQVLEVIANQKETIEKIKAHFDLLTSLPQQMIEPIFVSISTCNVEMGDWIINRFITTPGLEKHAELCGKIIISDRKKSVERLQVLLKHLLRMVHEIKEDFSSPLTQRVAPFIDIFQSSLHLIAPDLPREQPIDVNVSEKQICEDFIAHLAQIDTGYESEYLFKIKHLLMLLLSPPEPFVNNSVDIAALVQNFLTDSASVPETHSLQQRIIVSMLAAQSSRIANQVLREMDKSLGEILTWSDPQRVNQNSLVNKALVTFWLNLANDAKVKSRLQEQSLPLKLYEMIREPNDKSDRIVKNYNEEVLVLLVELILKVSAGHSELEEKLTTTVLEDLKNLSQKRDLFFINKVLLPLIKNEKTIPVCIVDRNLAFAQDSVPESTNTIMTTAASQSAADQATFVPTDLMNANQKKTVIAAIKEIAGNNAPAALNPQWTNVKTWQQKQEVCDFGKFWQTHQNKGPVMAFVNAVSPNGSKLLFGGYCSSATPDAPQDLFSDSSSTVYSQSQDFVFVNQETPDGKSLWQFFKPNNGIILEMFLDFESGGAISFATDFIMLSCSYDFSLSLGQKGGCQQINLESVPSSEEIQLDDPHDLTLNEAQFWIANSSSASKSGDKELETTQSITKVLQEATMPLFSVGMASRHPWLNQHTCQNYFRSRRVFNVPAHLTVRKMADILLYLQPNSTIELKHSDFAFEMSDTLQNVYDKFMAKPVVAERQQCILNLEFNRNALTAENVLKTVPKDTEIAHHVGQNYMPKNGFFTQFESAGGVKQFIEVTLASLRLWNNKALIESWSLWLKEVDSFSQIPLFFQQFLKNQSSKDLLFQILSGDPDKDSDAKKWEDAQKEAVQTNYTLLAEIFQINNDSSIRDAAVSAGFLELVLERLGVICGEKPRVYEDDKEVDEEVVPEVPQLQRQASSQPDPSKPKAKRQGVGYSTNQGQIFNVNAYLANKRARNDQTKVLVDICVNFFNCPGWRPGQTVKDIILQSSLLPLIEAAFRNGSWLEMAKEAPLYHSFMQLTRSIASQETLLDCLVELDKHYKPVQTDPIYKLLDKLNDLAKIFLSCIKAGSGSESEVPEKLAKDVTHTHEIIFDAIDDILRDRGNENLIDDALLLPADQQYRILLSPLRFDYMDMMQGSNEYKHHYKNTASSNQSPPQPKLVRLSEELTDLSNALPSDATNAIYVRVDKSRLDMMKAIITGATGTPYAHGCYEFDIFCENNYPNGPPKMNLMTTGANQIRFNPNLYACGKVCLSLLGTWRGNATENWDPKLSTILQVLLSTQAIIMSEEVYFNEPGFEQEAGTVDGEKRNEGYMNIVRWGNVKYAMLGQIRSPSKGFETAIKRHFYIKKAEILKDVHKWVERAEKTECLFTGLVCDHNHAIAKDFQKSKNRYKESLEALVKELEDELHKLDKPTNYQVRSKAGERKKAKMQKAIDINEGKVNLDAIDVSDDKEMQIDTTQKEIDVNDEKVKDRWSRYIGAMGAEAVSKQAVANIFLSGAGALGIEIAKNLVLAGCKSFTLHDSTLATEMDLAGQFYISKEDLGKNRADACLNRLQQLNYYVRVKQAPNKPLPHSEEGLTAAEWDFKQYDVVILTNTDYKTATAVNEYCRKHGKKFISTDCFGVFGRLFNDFGDNFEVLDKNGEQLETCIIQNIEVGEDALVQLLPKVKHGMEDGDEVTFVDVNGMQLLEGKSHNEENKGVKSTGINETIWKVKVVSPYSFRIGDTRNYTPYKTGGLSKPLRPKLHMKFKSFAESMDLSKEAPFDPTLAVADFEKLSHNDLCHVAFQALDIFREKNKGSLPRAWSFTDALLFMRIAMDLKPSLKDQPFGEVVLLTRFALQAQGVFNPICAFFGGYVAQEVVKAITNKFTPAQQLFYFNAVEVLPTLDIQDKHIEEQDEIIQKIADLKVDADGSRLQGLRICVGQDIVDKLAYSKVFMVGAGAIGCELLKNYAMIGVGTGKATKDKEAGQIVLTDPDVIEVSNLNRQFLFREKHLRKPKSQTAAAVAQVMNPELKGNVIARLDKVFEGSSHIFTDKFFEQQTVVTNALDNVKARLYIDARCVTAKTPLLESGTLGPKGHVQVILPFKTETYGQQADPEENNEVPFCTLKMFPEETLHCVEWARDKFGKMFTQMPQSGIKLLEEGEKFNAVSQQDMTILKDGVRLLKKRPTTFMDCIQFARMKFEKLFSHDVQQLMHVYPIDKTLKDGTLFWTLPKRPPSAVVFDKTNPLHRMFVSSLACLRANIFFVEIPSKAPRSEEFRQEVAEKAAFFQPAPFKINEAKAKEIQASVEKAANKLEEKKEEEPTPQEEEPQDDIQRLHEDFRALLKKIKLDKSKPVGESVLRAEEFEKDNDSNFHIDLIYSMANCRSHNYKLDPMDWLTVKLKAGRIVPALATTTAMIAGLQTLELIKVVKDCKKVDFRNNFINLAVNYMQAGEPQDVPKDKLLENLSVSIWDRWEINNVKEVKLAEVIATIEERHAGLEVRDVLRGNQPIYLSVMFKDKPAEKKKLLSQTVKELAESEGEPYVDLTITCVRKEDAEQKILAGVPPVRVWL